MRNFCTYFDSRYLTQGLALHDSMERHCVPFHLWILALDPLAESELGRLHLPNTTTVPLQDFLTDELRAATVDRTHRETIWTYTASWMLHVLNIESAAQAVNYLDADCFFFDSPKPVFEEIGNADVAITPHRFPARARHFESNGLYNVGLVHIKRTETGMACLREWEELCIEWCYERPEGDRYADQKYWDRLVPKYGAHPIAHLGADLAPWNQEAYDYSVKGGKLFVNGQQLIFYHFHQGLDPKWPMSKWVMDYCYWRYEKALEKWETSSAATA